MVYHVNQRLFAQSRLAQANYATFRPFSAGPPISYRQVVPTGQAFAQYRPNILNNRGHATGKDFPTRTWRDKHDVTLSLPEEVCSQEVGRALYDAFGAVVTDQPAAGPSPTVYRHKFTPIDPTVSRQLPARSFVELLADAHDVLWPSMVTESWALHGDGTGRLTMERSLRGSGKRTSPSGGTWGTTIDELADSLDYFYNSQMTLVVTPDGGDPIAYACRYKSFDLTIDNAILADDGYQPGCATFQTPGDRESGMIRSRALYGDRNYSLSTTFELAAGEAEIASLQDQDDLDIVLTAEGGVIEDAFTHKLTTTIPMGRYETVDLDNMNGIMVLKASTNLLYNTETDEIVEVELINDVASYTV